MRSIKIHDDTDAMLTALRGRIGSTKDEIIQELHRRYTAAQVEAITAGDRLRRVEEMLTKLVQRADDDDSGDGGTPPPHQVE